MGVGVSSVTCSVCASITRTREVFTDVSVPVPESWDGGGGDRGLERLVAAVLTPEHLRDDSAFMCGVCQRLQPALRVLEVERAPQHLIVTLNRFRFDVAAQRLKKVRRALPARVASTCRMFTLVPPGDDSTGHDARRRASPAAAARDCGECA